MKIYKSEVESGPIRWLLRITGWCSLFMGILMLITQKTLPALYDIIGVSFPDGPAMPLFAGVVLTVLDYFLPDPKRARRKLKRKYEKLYKAVCKALPSNKDGFAAAVTPTTRPLLERQIMREASFAVDLFKKVPLREMLVFIHDWNKQAAYAICLEITKAAQNTAKK